MAESWLHETVFRQRPTVSFYILTVLYCKPLYSAQAATVAKTGTISGHILLIIHKLSEPFPVVYSITIYDRSITISSCPIGPLCR